MRILRKTPLALSGLSLSFAALGNLLLPYGEIFRYTCGILSILTMFVFILKIILDYKNVREELKNPVVLSILPTSTMALMLLCTYAKPFVGDIATLFWYAAIIVHAMIMLLFVKRFIIGFKIQTVFPSYFVVCAGIVVASVTCPAMNARPLGQLIFYIGLGLYIIILPIVIYRMIKMQPLPEPARPTIAIFTAPLSLCIAGYFSAFEQLNSLLIYIMLISAVASYLYVSIKMISLLKLKFYPTYAAFTFPYVISAVAFKSANAFLMESGYNFFKFVPIVSQWIAIIAVVYVSIRYMAFLFLVKAEN